MKNFSESTEYDTTSKVFVKPRNGGVFLDINQDGLGTSLLVYNSLFPSYGNSPILNGTLTDDMKIGKNKHNQIKGSTLILLNSGEELNISAETKAKFLLISGKPIGEQIARGGPFVMNTKEEITQAISDYQSGKFVKQN